MRTWKCRCECGNDVVVDIQSLKSGNTMSCGCYKLEVTTKHGMWQSRVYQTWGDMKTRCVNPDHKSYPLYGGRGIAYQDSWETFEGFWLDMEEGYAEDLTLDRIDPNGGYFKENCQWVTKQEQGRNRTMMSTNKTGVTGVRTWTDRKNGTLYFVADAQGTGIKKSRHFSTIKYGHEGAFKLACEYREKFIEEFNESGINFSEYHGKEKGSNL